MLAAVSPTCEPKEESDPGLFRDVYDAFAIDPLIADPVTKVVSKAIAIYKGGSAYFASLRSACPTIPMGCLPHRPGSEG